MLNIPSPGARSISESCMTSVAKTLPKHMLSVKDVLALVAASPPESNSLSGVCIKVPVL